MNSNLESKIDSTLHSKFSNKLRQANLFGAFTELSSARFHKYLLQPKHFMRNGWLLDPELELDQRSVRAYILGDFPANPENANSVGQRLEINRKNKTATLKTTISNQCQTIEFDLKTMEVTKNKLAR